MKLASVLESRSRQVKSFRKERDAEGFVSFFKVTHGNAFVGLDIGMDFAGYGG
jgi:hypothetical protein